MLHIGKSIIIRLCYTVTRGQVDHIQVMLPKGKLIIVK